MPTADELLGKGVVTDLHEILDHAYPAGEFPQLAVASQNLKGLALRERSDHIADAILADTPQQWATFRNIILKARDAEPGLDGWMVWPITVAVARRAIEADNSQAFEEGLDLLASLTSRLSAEFALRLMLRADVTRTLKKAQTWAQSADEHVRRLASEGTRPYLPWALRIPQLQENHGITLPILHALYQDESEDVRRSVANHLNDLSRDIPEAVVETVQEWSQSSTPETEKLVKHALRTLIKKGHPGALAVLGFSSQAVEISRLELHTPNISFPGELEFSAELHNKGADTAQVAIDYVVYHLKANGTRTPKTFKLTTLTLQTGEKKQMRRRHAFKPISTRRYYDGTHTVALQVNGQQSTELPFELSGASPRAETKSDPKAEI
ncbi:DNA alkylation repair protein [Corynebacterium callunae]|uniref:DNA alkylation repair protein n=1 Tax=Corynebacterium callunae TaxID=1721 RepID=UPI003981B609